jgi:hypothetical protein
MDYNYRVVYRRKRQYWRSPEDKEWKLYLTQGNPRGRPYTNARAVKGIVSTENNYQERINGELEFKAQRFPLTQQWEDV